MESRRSLALMSAACRSGASQEEDPVGFQRRLFMVPCIRDISNVLAAASCFSGSSLNVKMSWDVTRVDSPQSTALMDVSVIDINI